MVKLWLLKVKNPARTCLGHGNPVTIHPYCCYVMYRAPPRRIAWLTSPLAGSSDPKYHLHDAQSAMSRPPRWRYSPLSAGSYIGSYQFHHPHIDLGPKLEKKHPCVSRSPAMHCQHIYHAHLATPLWPSDCGWSTVQ